MNNFATPSQHRLIATQQCRKVRDRLAASSRWSKLKRDGGAFLCARAAHSICGWASPIPWACVDPATNSSLPKSITSSPRDSPEAGRASTRGVLASDINSRGCMWSMHAMSRHSTYSHAAGGEALKYKSGPHLLSGLLGPPNASAERTPPCPNPNPQPHVAAGTPAPITRPAAPPPRRSGARVASANPTPNAALAFSSIKAFLDNRRWGGVSRLLGGGGGGSDPSSTRLPS